MSGGDNKQTNANQEPLMSVISNGGDDDLPVGGGGGINSTATGQPQSSSSAAAGGRASVSGKRPNETTSLLALRAAADPADCNERLDAWRLKTYIFLNGNATASKLFQLTLVMLILLNISVFVLSTERAIADGHHVLFDRIEAVSVAVFTVEYVARLWTITESGQKHYQHRVWGRLRYSVSITALIDFVSIFVFYLGLMINTKLPGLTWIRALRIFRILKTEAYTNAFQSLIGVISLNQEILGVGLAVAAVLLLLTSTFIYYVEKDNDPEQFGSIPKCMYASMLMLTGQGTPNPPLNGDFPIVTKVAICITAFFSVAIFAIPAAMLAYGFEVEADKVRRWKLTNQKLKDKCQREGKAFIPIPIERFQGFESDVDDDDPTAPAPAPSVVPASGAGPAGSNSQPPSTQVSSLDGPTKNPTRRAAAVSVTRMSDADSYDGVTGASPVTVSVNPAPGLVQGCMTCPHCARQITVSLNAS